jgi:hypothetical protein
MKRTIFILEDAQSYFDETSENLYPFLQVVDCEHSSGQILALFSNKEEEPLHLHNGEFCEESEEQIAVDLFLNKDVTFLEHVDFFTSKNPRIQDPLINDLKQL